MNEEEHIFWLFSFFFFFFFFRGAEAFSVEWKLELFGAGLIFSS